jgi:hypothetical protein
METSRPLLLAHYASTVLLPIQPEPFRLFLSLPPALSKILIKKWHVVLAGELFRDRSDLFVTLVLAVKKGSGKRFHALFSGFGKGTLQTHSVTSETAVFP